MLDGSKPNFWCGQGVKHENLMGKDFDPSTLQVKVNYVGAPLVP